MTRFFTTLAAVTVLGTCGFAQASSQADGPPFEIKHFALEVADARGAAAALKAPGVEVVMGPVENATEIFFFVRDNSGNAFELIQYTQ